MAHIALDPGVTGRRIDRQLNPEPTITGSTTLTDAIRIFPVPHVAVAATVLAAVVVRTPVTAAPFVDTVRAFPVARVAVAATVIAPVVAGTPVGTAPFVAAVRVAIQGDRALSYRCSHGGHRQRQTPTPQHHGSRDHHKTAIPGTLSHGNSPFGIAGFRIHPASKSRIFATPYCPGPFRRGHTSNKSGWNPPGASPQGVTRQAKNRRLGGAEPSVYTAGTRPPRAQPRCRTSAPMAIRQFATRPRRHGSDVE